MKKYIVVENGSFKAIESEKRPLNLALEEPVEKTWNNNDYSIVENGVNVSWLDYYNDPRWKCLTVTYNGTKLLEIDALRNIQVVIDALNRFKNISEEELEKLYKKALKKEKLGLEIEIEKLKEEKKKAQEEAKKYTDIVKKAKEVFSLINDLDIG